MSTLPAPLVPAGVCLTGCDWFQFHYQRLPKSKWWRRASDMARARNVMLWCAAFGQSIAGSLPDDDDDLAEAAGFGMDTVAFAALKAEIMAPWTLCSDGRWYHPTLAEVVLETWEKQSTKRKADAERKRRSRDRVRGAPEEVTRDIESAAERDEKPVTREIATQTERTEKTDREENISPTPSASAQSSALADDSQRNDDALFALFGDPGPESPPDPAREAFEAFNDLAREIGLPVPNALTDERRRKLKSRLDRGSAERWYRALAILRDSRWAHGFNDKGWQVTFDFLLSENNLNKVLDGNYLRLKPLETIGGKPQRTKLDERYDNFRRAVTATSLTTGRQPA